MAPKMKLLVACVLLLGIHLAAWSLTEGGDHVLAGVLLLLSWSLFILIGVSATRVRIKKPRKKKVPAPS